MVKGLIGLAWSGFYGGSVGNLLASWEQAGVFSYVLPFFILFALVFAILSKVKMFDNRGINSVISLAVALMALQFEFVPRFFSEVFPRLGIGLSIVLVILILVGLFTPEDKTGQKVFMWIFAGIGLIVAVVVLVSSGGAVGYGTGYWFQEYWGSILWILGVIGVFCIIFFSVNKEKEKRRYIYPEEP